jgi:hypothetical protein
MSLTLVRGVPDRRCVSARRLDPLLPRDPRIRSRAGIKVRGNAHGGVQLRLDAIDALEIAAVAHSSSSSWSHAKMTGEVLGGRPQCRL